MRIFPPISRPSSRWATSDDVTAEVTDVAEGKVITFLVEENR